MSNCAGHRPWQVGCVQRSCESCRIPMEDEMNSKNTTKGYQSCLPLRCFFRMDQNGTGWTPFWNEKLCRFSCVWPGIQLLLAIVMPSNELAARCRIYTCLYMFVLKCLKPVPYMAGLMIPRGSWKTACLSDSLLHNCTCSVGIYQRSKWSKPASWDQTRENYKHRLGDSTGYIRLLDVGIQHCLRRGTHVM